MNVEPRSGLNRYLLAQSIQFAASGMLSVLFPWLITQQLKESQINVGLAQTFANLPFFFLILLAGAVADGRNLKQYLPRLMVLMAMLPVALALLVATGTLTLFTATAVIFVLSAITAFATPARDAMLSHVVPHGPDLAKASVQTVAATFGGQVVGTLLAALASDVGAVSLLCVQAVLMTFAAMLVSRVETITPPVEHRRTGRNPRQLGRELMDGFKLVWRHERLRTLMLYLAISAPLFNGMFLVGIPLMVRDVFQGSSAMLSIQFTIFLTGMTLSSFVLSRLRPVERPGRLIMLLFLTHIAVFTSVWLFPDRNVFTALMFLWGLSSGVSMSLSRGMIQMAAPPAYLGRVLSMQQFSVMAGSPIGALLFGALAQSFGVLNSVLTIPMGVAIIWIVFRLRTGLWHFRREDHPHLQAS